MANNKYDPIVIKGKMNWASIVEPNTKFQPCWQVDLTIENAEDKKKLESLGITIKNKGDDRGDFITPRKGTHKKNGDEREAPVVIDAKKNPWDGRLVGNGSYGAVKILPYMSSYGSVALDLLAVQVIDLVPFEREDGFDEEDGFELADPMAVAS